MPASMAGTTGLKMAEESAFSAAMARTVGPPQGMMFITPAPRATTPESTSRFMPSRWYSGSIAETVMRKVVAPSPSSETAMVRIAVASTTRSGSPFTKRSRRRIIGSNRPTSSIRPK